MMPFVVALALALGQQADPCRTNSDCAPGLLCRANPATGAPWCVRGCEPAAPTCPPGTVCAAVPGPNPPHLPPHACRRGDTWLP